MKDLFSEQEKLPIEMQKLINKHAKKERFSSVKKIEKFRRKCKKLNYNFSYDFLLMPFNLRKRKKGNL